MSKLTASDAQKISLEGEKNKRSNQLNKIVQEIKTQAGFGSTHIFTRTAYKVFDETARELIGRKFALVVGGDCAELLISWGKPDFSDIPKAGLPDWLLKKLP